MKEISELNFPDDLKYAEDHEWARMENGEATIGICDYAQDQLGDVVFVELPQVGDTFEKGQEFGTVESVKAVSELFTPLSGEVTAVNGNLEDAPELVNNEPYAGGWMIRIKPANAAEMDELMTKDAYLAMLKG
ncbi:MAG: glycine cleavage system protein GcvH [Deltaproteobacteria bacterium]|jgi:glycine cleavage system H protein|nr:glycine cleavage system protein GcvH [Deltaproteobacteria bacterium]